MTFTLSCSAEGPIETSGEIEHEHGQYVSWQVSRLNHNLDITVTKSSITTAEQ